MRTFLGCVAFATIGLCSGAAVAQISQDEGGAEPVPVESEPMPEDPVEPAPVTASAAPKAGTAPPPEEEEYEPGAYGGARFRWGVSGMVGPSFGVSPVAAFGVDARVGAQVNDWFGFYGQPMFQFGVGFTTDDDEFTRSFGQALIGMAAMFDFTFADFVYLAVGPEYVTGVVGLRDGGEDFGPFFSIASRFGVVLGKMKANRRKGLALGLDTRVILVDSGVVVTPLLSAGFEYF